MTKRTTQIYINDAENLINNSIQHKGTVAGYFNVMLEDEDTNETTTIKHFINTARPLMEHMGVWSARFKGSMASFNAYAKLCENVSVTVGNIVKPINGGKGKKHIACFIAVFDNNKVFFEVHYPVAKGIFYVTDVVIGRNDNNQLVTDLLTMSVGNGDVSQVFAQTVSEKDCRRIGSKLTLQQEDDILHRLQMAAKGGAAKKANTQANIAISMNVSQQAIGKLKARFTKEGLL